MNTIDLKWSVMILTDTSVFSVPSSSRYLRRLRQPQTALGRLRQPRDDSSVRTKTTWTRPLSSFLSLEKFGDEVWGQQLGDLLRVASGVGSDAAAEAVDGQAKAIAGRLAAGSPKALPLQELSQAAS